MKSYLTSKRPVPFWMFCVSGVYSADDELSGRGVEVVEVVELFVENQYVTYVEQLSSEFTGRRVVFNVIRFIINGFRIHTTFQIE